MTVAALPIGPEIVIRRARCTGLAAQRHRVLDALEHLAPDTGLAGSAILVVRRLPGVVSGAPARIHGVDLRQVAGGASRPGAGLSGSALSGAGLFSKRTAESEGAAVLFADQAELLCCLANEVGTGGRLGWWWQALFARGDGRSDSVHPAQVVASAFSQFARALPAAASAQPRAIGLAANLLDPAGVLRVLAAMAGEHAAQGLAGAASSGLSRTDGRASARSSAPLSAQSAGEQAGDESTWAGSAGAGSVDAGSANRGIAGSFDAAPDGQNGSAAWNRWLAEASLPDRSSRAVVALVTAALGLHRSPLVARSASFAQVVERWLDGTEDRLADRPAVNDLGTPAGGVCRPLPDLVDDRDGSVTGTGVVGETASAMVFATAAGLQGSNEPLLPRSVDVVDGAGGVLAPDEVIRTRFGGAFYLLALLDSLDLPGSATGPGEPGPMLTRWGVLSLLLRGLGADPADDLFAALAGLDGSEPEQPPAVVDDSHPWVFRVPTLAREWLGPLLEPEPESEPGHEPGPEQSGAERWGGSLAGLVLALLGRVGLDGRIIEAPASIEISPLHIRVHLRFDDIDLEIRRAGLDRDPGWVPALGRSVELIFG